MNPFHISLLKKSFIGIALLIALAGTIQSITEISRLIKARQAAPFFFNGIKVAGLQTILKGQKYVGYYTDRNIDKDPRSIAEFSQFQLELAPVVLDSEDLNHPFIIINCASPANAAAKLTQLNAKALSRNNFGMIIAIRKAP
jgi:hypothetical protein